MNNGRDCPHGRQVGKCDTCDLIKTELELQQVTADRDALAAQLIALGKIHSDLTNADMVLDDGEHSGYLITNEQLEDMEHYLSEPILCLAAHDAEVAAKAVMGFAEIIRGAYSSGFSPAALTVYDVYQAARNHVFSNYETEAPIWKDDDAEAAKNGLTDIQSGAVLGAVKFCNHYMAFPVNNGSIANAVIAVDDLTNYADQLRAKTGAA